MDIGRLEGVSPFRVTSRVHGYFYHLDGSVVCEGHFLQHLTIRGGMEWGKTPSDAAATMAANCSDACNVTLSEKIAFWDMHFSSCIDLHHEEFVRDDDKQRREVRTVRGPFHGCLNTASYRCGRSEGEAAAPNRGLQNPLPAKFGRRQRRDPNLSRPLTRPSHHLGYKDRDKWTGRPD